MNNSKSTPKKTILFDGITYYLPPIDNQLFKSPPELKTPENGDWYIYFNVWDFKSGKWKPQKYYTDILNKRNIISNERNRKKIGEALTNQAYEVLLSGVNPKSGMAVSPFESKSIEEVLAEASDDSPVPILKDCIDKWLKIKSGKDNPKKEAPENKENTEKNYGYFFKGFLKYCKSKNIERLKLDKIPKHIVYEFFEKRYNDGKIGDSTYNTQLAWLKAMFAYYSKIYDFKDNIKNLEDKENVDDSERFEPFTPDQVRKILNYLDNPQTVQYHKYSLEVPANKFLALVSRTIYYSFIRISEIRRIKIKHVKNYKKGFLELETSITKNKKKVHNKLYIDPNLIDEYSKLNWEMYFKDKKYDNYYVFTPDLVPSITKTNSYSFSKSFRTVLEKLDIYDKGNYSLYSLKASGNIAAYHSGWDLFQISIQNRHSTIQQTETYLRRLKIDIASKPRPVRERV